MDSANFSASKALDTSTQLQSNQEEWVLAGVSNLSMQRQPTHERNAHAPRPGPHSNAPPPPSHTYNSESSTPASLQQVGRGGVDPPISTYLHIPCIQKLYEENANLAASLKNVTKVLGQITDQNERLQAKLTEKEQSPQLEGPTNYAMFRRTMSGSLAPSDSLSQQASRQSSRSLESREFQGGNAPILRTLQPQPAQRPPELPFEVLWQRDDCKHDTQGAKPIESNSGRPRMKNAIRNKDGTTIDKGYFRTIQKAATSHVATLIVDEEERLKKSLPTKQMTKKYFESYRPKQWHHAIAELEDEHPILTYAAGHWKAEQLLATQLTTKRTHRKKASGHPCKKTKQEAKRGESSSESGSGSDEENSEEADNDNSVEKVAAGSKRKRVKATSNPSETPATTTQDNGTGFEPAKPRGEPQGQDVEMESPEPAVSKRLGKQAAFALISKAASEIGATQEKPSEPTLVRPPHRASPLNLISVDSTYDGLKDVFTGTTFRTNMPPNAIELLDALKKISGSAALNSSDPSPTVLEFIERIESADPTAPDIDEDNTNLGWGHSQFTSGGLRCRTVLQTWSDIGNVKTAYRLLAASLKTGLVARHLCFTNKIKVSGSASYLSDAYLREVVEILWNIRAQDPIPTPLAAAGQHDSAAVGVETPQTSAAAATSTQPAPHEPQELAERSKQLERLHANELRAWMHAHSIALPGFGKRKKSDLIAAIIQELDGRKIPTSEDISRLVSQRPSQKRGSAAEPA